MDRESEMELVSTPGESVIRGLLANLISLDAADAWYRGDILPLD